MLVNTTTNLCCLAVSQQDLCYRITSAVLHWKKSIIDQIRILLTENSRRNAKRISVYAQNAALRMKETCNAWKRAYILHGSAWWPQKLIFKPAPSMWTWEVLSLWSVQLLKLCCVYMDVRGTLFSRRAHIWRRRWSRAGEKCNLRLARGAFFFFSPRAFVRWPAQPLWRLLCSSSCSAPDKRIKKSDIFQKQWGN